MIDLNTTEEFSFQEFGMGMIAAYNTNLSLQGGFRSGGSPPNYTRLKYLVEYNSNQLGHVELFVKDGTQFDVLGIVNIELNKANRRCGIGRDIIASIMATTKNDLMIYDIKSSAVGFWIKLGAVKLDGKNLERKNHQDAIIYYNP